MAGGYVGIGYGSEDMPQQVPDSVKSEASALANDIIAGNQIGRASCRERV